jgi:hypothetical protein
VRLPCIHEARRRWGAGKLKTKKEGGREVFLIEEQKQLFDTWSKAKRDVPNLQADIATAEGKPAEYLKARRLVLFPPQRRSWANPSKP